MVLALCSFNISFGCMRTRFSPKVTTKPVAYCLMLAVLFIQKIFTPGLYGIKFDRIQYTSHTPKAFKK
jgi:hypothetical protein